MASTPSDPNENQATAPHLPEKLANRRTSRALPAAAMVGTLAAAVLAAPAAAAESRLTKPTRADTQHPNTSRVPAPTKRDLASTAVPTGTSHMSTHTVREGDTPWGIAATHGIDVDTLLAANGLTRDAMIFPGDILTIGSVPTTDATRNAASTTVEYTVRPGDTLWDIAETHGLTLDELYATNGLNAQSIIYPGETLLLSAPTPPTETSGLQQQTVLNEEQRANAARIIAIGRESGVPDRGIAIALATAMVESWLTNLSWGDRDSVGLFQQRPSAGWGTVDQIVNTEHSIRAFFGGENNPNEHTIGLLDVDGWQTMSFSSAAQAVQVSSFPERYGAWEEQAWAWIEELG